MIIAAQRWTEGIQGGEQFGRPVVEALVLAPTSNKRLYSYRIYSAFYDPNQGQTLATAFKWWDRGAQGMLPSLCSHLLEILSNWSLPADEVSSMQQYATRLETLVVDLKKSMEQVTITQ